MEPHELMHHGPGWFGFWHAGLPGLFWLVLPALFVLPWLALLAVLLWSSRHALLDRLGMRPVGSATSMQGKRYTRDALRGDADNTMRDERGQSDYSQSYDATNDGAPEETFRPRPDTPIDWS
jgi:hypothetical protein